MNFTMDSAKAEYIKLVPNNITFQVTFIKIKNGEMAFYIYMFIYIVLYTKFIDNF